MTVYSVCQLATCYDNSPLTVEEHSSLITVQTTVSGQVNENDHQIIFFNPGNS